jgi:hypothetical protein
VGLELHAQDFARDALDVFNGLGDLDAAALAAATGVDLGFHHPDRATQFLRGFHRFLHRECRDTAGHRHTKLTQDFLALVLVNLHEVSLGLGGLFDPAKRRSRRTGNEHGSRRLYHGATHQSI